METGVPAMGRKRSDWSREGKCIEYPRLFTGDESRGRMGLTRPICATCPVSSLNGGTGECLSYALAHDMTGIWDGKTTRERKGLPEDQKKALIQTVPEIEPSFQSYLKKELKEEPRLIEKPKTVALPSSAPKVWEKPKSGSHSPTKKQYPDSANTTTLVRMVESPEEQLSILDQLLLGLQSLSSPVVPLAV
jgi:hypothetical protein